MSVKLVQINIEDLKVMDLAKIHEVHALDSIEVIKEDGNVDILLSMKVNKLIVENMVRENLQNEIMGAL